MDRHAAADALAVYPPGPHRCPGCGSEEVRYSAPWPGAELEVACHDCGLVECAPRTCPGCGLVAPLEGEVCDRCAATCCWCAAPAVGASVDGEPWCEGHRGEEASHGAE
jgi:hypothetical protein